MRAEGATLEQMALEVGVSPASVCQRIKGILKGAVAAPNYVHRGDADDLTPGCRIPVGDPLLRRLRMEHSLGDVIDVETRASQASRAST
jgi:hypothetical protein